MKAFGAKTWLISDGFFPADSIGMKSHEAVCVLNTSDSEAEISMTLYFQDREPMIGFDVKVGARRTQHIRMDSLLNKNGEPVPQETPYAILVQSNVSIVVQYSRMDTRQAEMALMSTITHPVE